MSTYFGSLTMVLKFPFTNAASTNGRDMYKGFWFMLSPGEPPGEARTGDGSILFWLGERGMFSVGDGRLRPRLPLFEFGRLLVGCHQRLRFSYNGRT